MKLPLLSTIVVFSAIALGSTASAQTYIQNFDAFADGTTVLGDGSVMSGTASVQGGALRLTEDGVAFGFASFSVPALANSSQGWQAVFDITIIDSAGNNEPADGMSLNYGNAALGELGSAEEGMASVGAVFENVSFEIDTWLNGGDEQGVNIAEKVAGVDADLAFTNGPILADGTTVSGQVTVSWDPVNGASYSTTGLLTNAAFINVPTTFAAADSHTFILSGRTGGANETKLIDNLRITTFVGVFTLGDANDDGVLNNLDIASFVLALINPVAYQAMFPDVDPEVVLDMNGDGAFNNLDIAGFVTALLG